MIEKLYHLFARGFRALLKTTKVYCGNLSATFFVPIYNHYICSDLADIKSGRREPFLYKWLKLHLGIIKKSRFFYHKKDVTMTPKSLNFDIFLWFFPYLLSQSLYENC